MAVAGDNCTACSTNTNLNTAMVYDTTLHLANGATEDTGALVSGGYSSGQWWQGPIWTEQVAIGNTVLSSMKFVVMQNQSGLFSETDCQGDDPQLNQGIIG